MKKIINKIQNIISLYGRAPVPALLNKRTWALITLLIILITGITTMYLTGGASSASWWHDGWTYRQRITFENSGSAISSERKVKIDVDTATLITDGKLQSDCDDIRFTDQHGDQLEYFIDTDTADCNDASTDFYVKVPEVIADDQSIFMYYGNSAASRVRANDFFGDGTVGEGLVGYWPMDETTADTCINGTDDNCDYATTNDGAWNGDATYTSSGKVGGATTYDGTGDYVDVGDVHDFTSADPFTFAGWIKPANISQMQVIVDKRVATDTWYRMAIDSNGNAAIEVANNYPTNYKVIISADSYNDDNWHHVVATRSSGGNLELFVDGSSVGTDTGANFDISNSNNLYFGASQANTSTTSVNGQIDEVRIYQRALSAAEITQIYNGGNGSSINVPLTFTPNSSSTASEETSPGPVGYWSFDEGYGTTTQDSSVNNNDGTLGVGSSAPAWTTEDQCINGKCLYFDGVDDYVDSGANVGSLGPSDSFTVSAWINPVLDSTDQVITGNGWGGVAGWHIRVTSGNKVRFIVFDAGGGEYSGMDSDVLSSGWTYATGIWNGSSASVFIDGLEQSTTSIDAGTVNEEGSENVTIGATPETANRKYFSGHIDEVKIYPYARSAAEIKSDFLAGAGSHGANAVLGANTNLGVNQQALSDGLVGYWKMDESSWNGTSDEVVDASGNANHGTASGDATTAGGKYGSGGMFDGTGDYVDVGNSTSIKPNTGNFSVSIWIDPDKDDTHAFLRDRPLGSVGTQEGWWLGSAGGASGHLSVGIEASDNSAKYYENASGYTDTEGWFNIAFTWDNSADTLTIYKNGSDVTDTYTKTLDTSLTGKDISNTSNLILGDSPSHTSNREFDGTIDEVRIYNRALSAAEVRALYNFAPGPAVHLKMDEGSGSSANDSSGNSNTGTLNNNAGWGTGKFGKGVTLDGTDDSVSISDF